MEYEQTNPNAKDDVEISIDETFHASNATHSVDTLEVAGLNEEIRKKFEPRKSLQLY